MVTTPASEAPLTVEQLRDRQIRQAEELLFAGEPRTSFAKALYRGEFRGSDLFPYPRLDPKREAEAREAVEAVRKFARSRIDPVAIDREADIPREVIEGLGRLGVLGMTAPVAYGGRGFNQMQYCRVMEVIGGHDASTAVFVNAHHSIGIRALLLFGTDEQKSRWLPPLVRGEKLAAFALTEEQAGSDAANVQTTATPTPDGEAYILNGGKRYITNGGIADVLTVMARTPDPGGGESKITAFLVTPDLPGFEVVQARRPKCGIRGTATGQLAFRNMRVPASQILGPVGKGLRVALTVLDFGRTTFGASCTGAAKTCLEAAVRHARSRRQFGRPIGEFELIQKKIARMAALIYAMEATTYQTAALIDSGAEDYMLETAILKVFATEALWEIVYETLQIHGGEGYFLDQPYERWMRDARINQIGEGANEVLRSFIAMVGLRDVGKGLQELAASIKSPGRALGAMAGFTASHLDRWFRRPRIPVQHPMLRAEARAMSRRVVRFADWCERTLIAHRRDPNAFLDRQLEQERIAEAAMALVTSACVLSRLDAEAVEGGQTSALGAGRLYLRLAARRFDDAVRTRNRSEDEAIRRVARAYLGSEADSRA
ncbi:MAG: acyl-CoA dehydrogenase [Isosphaeraceae bacterium]|jgi:alkylation response protein AidB-like acyl-CoA dehydrogenase|nr:MAG: acyl-CoA dehydrogenase [Isosphaeraceae bacterium]